MLISAAAIFIGLLALFWGADRFVVGAGPTARNLGVSPGLIGLVIVGFATSPPEMLVSAVASLDDAAGLAAGNALGSKLANLGLVPGTAILSSPLGPLRDAALSVMGMLTLVVVFLAYNRRPKVQLTRPIGGALLAVFLTLPGLRRLEILELNQS